MKKLLGILVLGLLWCSASFAEEKIKLPEEWVPVTVNSLVKKGFKIIDVQEVVTLKGPVLLYTLQKSKEVFLCRVVGLGGHETRCFMP